MYLYHVRTSYLTALDIFSKIIFFTIHNGNALNFRNPSGILSSFKITFYKKTYKLRFSKFSSSNDHYKKHSLYKNYDNMKIEPLLGNDLISIYQIQLLDNIHGVRQSILYCDNQIGCFQFLKCYTFISSICVQV